METTLKILTAEIKAKLIEAMSSKEAVATIADTKANDDGGRFKVVISTADQDRQGDIVKQEGWVLDNYLKNPVVLFGHDYGSLPIGVCDKIGLEDGKLVAEGRFATHQFAQEVRALYDAGILVATSVGFIPLEMTGNLIEKAELLEFSFVPVPANPHALSLAAAKKLEVGAYITKGLLLKDETAPPAAATNSEAATGGDTTIVSPAPEAQKAEGDEGAGDTTPPADPEKPEEKPEGEDEGEESTDINQLAADLNTAVSDVQAMCADTEITIEDLKAGVLVKVGVIKAIADELVALVGEEAEIVEQDGKKMLVLKAGRVLSKKNRTLIENTLAKLNESGAALKELLETADAEDGDGAGKSGKDDTDSEDNAGLSETAETKEAKAALEAWLKNREVLRELATIITGALENTNAKVRANAKK